VVRVEYGRVDLEDRHGRTRGFPLGPGYLLEGRPVILTAPRRPAPPAAARTASGSVAVKGARARIARASRIYVEGRHDAELIAQVWGWGLRVGRTSLRRSPSLPPQRQLGQHVYGPTAKLRREVGC
jgi:hypothetical protein